VIFTSFAAIKQSFEEKYENKEFDGL